MQDQPGWSWSRNNGINSTDLNVNNTHLGQAWNLPLAWAGSLAASLNPAISGPKCSLWEKS